MPRLRTEIRTLLADRGYLVTACVNACCVAIILYLMTIIDDVCEKITKIQTEESEDLNVTRMIETIFIGTHAASHLPLSYLSEYELSSAL